MKLTNGDIFTAVEPLKVLMRQRFPVKTSLALAKMFHKLDAELKVIEEVRTGLFSKYGSPIPGGFAAPKDGDPNQAVFLKEHAELMGEEVEVEVEKMKVLDQLGDDAKIEPAVLMALEKFIE